MLMRRVAFQSVLLTSVTLCTFSPTLSARSTWNITELWQWWQSCDENCAEACCFSESTPGKPEKPPACVLLMKLLGEVQCRRCISSCVGDSPLPYTPSLYSISCLFSTELNLEAFPSYPHSKSFSHSQILYITESSQWTFFPHSV